MSAGGDVGVGDDVIAIRGTAALGLLSFFGAFALAAHGPLTDHFALVFGEGAHHTEGQIPLGRILKLHVAEYEMAAGRPDGLLDGLLMLGVTAVAADIGADEGIGAAGLNVGQSGLHTGPGQEEAAADAAVVVFRDNGQREGQSLLAAGMKLGSDGGGVWAIGVAHLQREHCNKICRAGQCCLILHGSDALRDHVKITRQ